MQWRTNKPQDQGSSVIKCHEWVLSVTRTTNGLLPFISRAVECRVIGGNSARRPPSRSLNSAWLNHTREIGSSSVPHTSGMIHSSSSSVGRWGGSGGLRLVLVALSDINSCKGEAQLVGKHPTFSLLKSTKVSTASREALCSHSFLWLELPWF